MKHFLISTFEALAVGAIAAVLLQLFLLQPFRVSGTSMEPNFHDGERLLIDKISPHFLDYRRGETIVFLQRLPAGNEHLVKRIIGLPKERIVIRDHHITLFDAKHPKGFTLDESHYQPRTLRDVSIDTQLGANEYFVLGDNRPVSNDSEAFGPIKRNQIVGRAALRYFPFDKISFFSFRQEY